jgi:uncharacterized delta-60 repeat protein
MNISVSITQGAVEPDLSPVTRRIIRAACVMFASIALVANAAPGDLDPTFAAKGRFVSGFGKADDQASAVEIQADGKVVVAGYAQHGYGNQLLVARYNGDGSRDTSFAGLGSVEASFGIDSDSQGEALAIQTDGKIVAAGFVRREGQINFALVRYNSDGSLDSSFGTAGLVETDFGGPAYVHAMGVQIDGKILAVGSTGVGTHDEFAIARYNQDGSPDLSFGAGGKVIGAGTNTGQALAFVADGKFIVAGAGPVPGGNGVLLARYDAEGKIDSSFGTNGLAGIPANVGNRLALAIQSSVILGDKILVATGHNLVRFLTNGAPDTGFGTGGVINAGNQNCGIAFQVSAGSPNRILVAGTAANPSGGALAFTLSRYLLNGAPDTAFGNSGVVYTPIGGFADVSQAMRSRSGKIVVVGYSGSDTAFSLGANFALARYNFSDGSLDDSFDGDGKRLDDFGNATSVAGGVALQADGKILVTGNTLVNNNYAFGLLRLNSDGTPDLGLAGTGKVITRIGQSDTARAVALQPDGKIVLVGESDGKFAVARYNQNGSLDSMFNGGTVTTPVGSVSDASAVAIQADGKIVAAGHTRSSISTSRDFALVRYLSNGMPDLAFGSGGKVITNVAGDEIAAAVAVQPDGKILLAGSFAAGSSSQILLLRYNSNGSLDRAFGADGVVATTFPGDLAAAGYGMALQADGRIIVVGATARPNQTAEMAVLRYLPSGVLDASFNGDGRVRTPIGIVAAIADAVAIQPDGRIVVGGYSVSAGENAFAAVRYNPNGSIDNFYGVSGKAKVDVAAGNDTAYSMAVDSSGRAILAGTSENVLAVVRLEGGGAAPTPTPTPARLANISTRLRVETGDNVLIGGFIVAGTQPKKVIVRAIGPSLPFADKLSNPTLELYGPNGLIDANDNWVDSLNKQAIIDSSVPPSNDLEAAIVATLPANNSSYTAVVRGANNGTGAGLVEVYDLDAAADSKLANISTRGFVQTGDNVLIAGTIVVGDGNQNVIVRAIGPSLPFAGKLADPVLELRDQNGTLIQANDDWVDSPSKQAIIDSTIPPTNDSEAAIVATLPAAAASYTAIVRGVNGTTGIAVVEVYALP